MSAKVACRADLCYNEDLKMLCLDNAGTLSRLANLCRRLAMDMIPHDNTPHKQCSGPCGRTLPVTPEFFHRNGNGFYSLCKLCKSEKTKVHNALPEVRERRQKRYQAYWPVYKERPEAQARINTYQQAYRQIPEDREQKRAYLRAYGKRPEVREHNREWLQVHREIPGVRERINEQERALYRTSPKKREQARNKVNNRVARRKAAPGKHTYTQIQEQYARQKGKCYYCRKKVIWGKHHLDHVVPLSRGGSNDISNLVITCSHCNLRKNNKLPHEWPDGGRLL